MSFLCPNCSDPDRTLATIDLIELPSDARSDEITLQVIKCASCGFAGIAVYEESRRGALGQESFLHTGYGVNQGDLTRIRNQIKACPDFRNPRCDCLAHQILGKKDARGNWIGIRGITKDHPFKMDL